MNPGIPAKLVQPELIAGAKDKREVAEIDLVLGAYHVVPTNAEIGQLAYNDVSTMTAFAFSMTKKIFSEG